VISRCTAVRAPLINVKQKRAGSGKHGKHGERVKRADCGERAGYGE
jgi:hypothetical protein